MLGYGTLFAGRSEERRRTQRPTAFVNAKRESNDAYVIATARCDIMQDILVYGTGIVENVWSDYVGGMIACKYRESDQVSN